MIKTPRERPNLNVLKILTQKSDPIPVDSISKKSTLRKPFEMCVRNQIETFGPFNEIRMSKDVHGTMTFAHANENLNSKKKSNKNSMIKFDLNDNSNSSPIKEFAG